MHRDRRPHAVSAQRGVAGACPTRRLRPRGAWRRSSATSTGASPRSMRSRASASPVSRSKRGDVVDELVALGAEAERVRMPADARARRARRRSRRAGTRARRSRGSARHRTRVLRASGTSAGNVSGRARKPGSAGVGELAARGACRRSTARRRSRTAASCRGPRRGSSLRRGTRPDRRAPSRASACSATASRTAVPRGACSRDPTRSARPRALDVELLDRRARHATISPSVSPWRIGIGSSPTNDRKRACCKRPSSVSRAPPIGFGRSSTTTRTPRFAHARSAQHRRPDERVVARADVLQVDERACRCARGPRPSGIEILEAIAVEAAHDRCPRRRARRRRRPCPAPRRRSRAPDRTGSRSAARPRAAP